MKRKLTNEQVREIRGRLENGDSLAEIATDYEVSPHTVVNIRDGVTYDHLPHEEFTSIRELAERFAVSPEKIERVALGARFEVLLHRNRRYIPNAAISAVLEPLLTLNSGEWVTMAECRRITGASEHLLKRLIEEKEVVLLPIGFHFYVNVDEVRRVLSPRAPMLTLREASGQVGLSHQRLAQLRQKGRITTLAIGKRYYVDLEQLRAELDDQGLGRPPLDIDWDAAGLGTKPDYILAEELHVSVGTIRQKRQDRGISSYRESQWMDIDWDAAGLGTKPDEPLAAALGVSVYRVRKQRESRSIPPYRESQMDGNSLPDQEAEKRHRVDIDWDAAGLGTKPDQQLAEELGVSVYTVARHRRERSISPYRESQIENDTTKEEIFVKDEKHQEEYEQRTHGIHYYMWSIRWYVNDYYQYSKRPVPEALARALISASETAKDPDATDEQEILAHLELVRQIEAHFKILRLPGVQELKTLVAQREMGDPGARL